jgi:hypothetical protein
MLAFLDQDSTTAIADPRAQHPVPLCPGPQLLLFATRFSSSATLASSVAWPTPTLVSSATQSSLRTPRPEDGPRTPLPFCSRHVAVDGETSARTLLPVPGPQCLTSSSPRPAATSPRGSLSLHSPTANRTRLRPSLASPE